MAVLLSAEIFWQFSRRVDAALLTQGKDDDKEKWKNSRREACYTLSIEGIFLALFNKDILLQGWSIFSNSMSQSKIIPANSHIYTCLSVCLSSLSIILR